MCSTSFFLSHCDEVDGGKLRSSFMWSKSAWIPSLLVKESSKTGNSLRLCLWSSVGTLLSQLCLCTCSFSITVALGTFLKAWISGCCVSCSHMVLRRSKMQLRLSDASPQVQFFPAQNLETPDWEISYLSVLQVCYINQFEENWLEENSRDSTTYGNKKRLVAAGCKTFSLGKQIYRLTGTIVAFFKRLRILHLQLLLKGPQLAPERLRTANSKQERC